MPIAVHYTAHFNTTGGAVTHGQQVNASNTGLTGVGLTPGDLTPTAGGTYSTPSEVVELLDFTSAVTVTGDNVTIRKCRVRFAGSENGHGIMVVGDNVTIEDCEIVASTGSYKFGIKVGDDDLPTGTTISRCDISVCENWITMQGHTTLIETSYLHVSSGASQPGFHLDGIEVFEGTNNTVSKCRIGDTTLNEDAAFNITPAFGAASVTGYDILDCFIDGGTDHILVAVQSTGDVTNVRVLRNVMGGHTALSDYNPIDNQNGALARTPAEQTTTPQDVLMPITGDDLNTWGECSDLTPDRTGETVTQGS